MARFSPKHTSWLMGFLLVVPMLAAGILAMQHQEAGLAWRGSDGPGQAAVADATPALTAAPLGPTARATPLLSDRDGDGLSDDEEVHVFGTDPDVIDTDGDGLDDATEVIGVGSNPLMDDTDGDRLDDGTEVLGFGTDPLSADTDGDGVNDGQEVAQGTNPLDPLSW